MFHKTIMSAVVAAAFAAVSAAPALAQGAAAPAKPAAAAAPAKPAAAAKPAAKAPPANTVSGKITKINAADQEVIFANGQGYKIKDAATFKKMKVGATVRLKIA